MHALITKYLQILNLIPNMAYILINCLHTFYKVDEPFFLPDCRSSHFRIYFSTVA